MTRGSHRYSMQPLPSATALLLFLLAGGAPPAVAGSIAVTGANGANSFQVGVPGGAGGPAAATEKTTYPSNAATAIGGNGGGGYVYYPMSCLTGHVLCNYGSNGGAGGPATATATTTVSGAGAALGEATSRGGTGGRGGFGYYHAGNGGNGGNAISSAMASAGRGSASATATSSGGAGGAAGWGLYGTRGFGGTAGTASAMSDAKNASGEALATASGGSVTAVSNLTVGSGPEPAAAITAGWVVSDAEPNPGGLVIGYGAMSAGSGESGVATALFHLGTTVPEALDLKLLSDSFLGTSDTVELTVVAGAKTITYDFTNLTFPKQLLLGTIAAATVSLSFDLKSGNGFGFTYELVDPPLAATRLSAAIVPEPSTWVMLLLGFAGLGYASMRHSYGLARHMIGLVP